MASKDKPVSAAAQDRPDDDAAEQRKALDAAEADNYARAYADVKPVTTDDAEAEQADAPQPDGE